MVSSYLVHHGYSSTAEKFSEITGQSFTEDIVSIKTRQSKEIHDCAQEFSYELRRISQKSRTTFMKKKLLLNLDLWNAHINLKHFLTF